MGNFAKACKKFRKKFVLRMYFSNVCCFNIVTTKHHVLKEFYRLGFTYAT